MDILVLQTCLEVGQRSIEYSVQQWGLSEFPREFLILTGLFQEMSKYGVHCVWAVSFA